SWPLDFPLTVARLESALPPSRFGGVSGSVRFHARIEDEEGLLMIVTCLASFLLVGEVDANKLRQLAKMPMIFVGTMTSFDAHGYYEWRSDYAPVIVRLREVDPEKADKADQLFQAVRAANRKNDRAQANQRWAELVSHLESALADHPGDVKLTVEVGRMFAIHHPVKAEQTFLRAPGAASKDPEVLAELGSPLTGQAWEDVARTAGMERELSRREAMILYFRNNPPSPETMRRVHELLDRANQYWQECIAAAPERGESFVGRSK